MRPSILADFILLSMLDVAPILFSTQSTQRFWAGPKCLATRDVPARLTDVRLIHISAEILLIVANSVHLLTQITIGAIEA